MSGPSIRKTAALSAAIHATLFLLSLLVLRHSAQIEMPSPYVVTLVSPSGGRALQQGPAAEEPQPAQTESAPAKHGVSVEKENTRDKKESKVKETRNREHVEDRIAELAALKKLERLAKLRREMDNIKAGGKAGSKAASRGVAKQFSKGSGAAGQGGSVMGGYIDKITGQIHDYWKIPDIFDKKIVAVIDVRILKDGTLFPLGIEKSSGDRHFDNFALATIKSVQRVSPPPPGMDDVVGIRFYP
jgi:colicin import membrane protein